MCNNNIMLYLITIFNIIFLSITYFIIIRSVAMLTYRIFPKFNDIKEKSKTVVLLESLSELGLIGVFLYVLRDVLIEVFLYFDFVYSDKYEKFVIFVMNPALFSGPSDLKKKLDFSLS